MESGDGLIHFRKYAPRCLCRQISAGKAEPTGLADHDADDTQNVRETSGSGTDSEAFSRPDEHRVEEIHQLFEEQVHGRQSLHMPINAVLELGWIIRAKSPCDKKSVPGNNPDLLRTTDLDFESESAVAIALHK